MTRVKDWLADLLFEGLSARLYDLVMITVILASVVTTVLDTVPSIRPHQVLLSRSTDFLAVAMILFDYLARLWLADRDPRRHSRGGLWRARLAFVLSPLAIIDLLTLLPFLLELFTELELRYLLLLRMLRLLKFSRHSPALATVVQVFLSERKALGAALLLILIFVLFSGSIIWSLEHQAQPDRLGTIPDAMWWAIVTVGTVGYGDVVPVTTAGKLASTVIIVFGTMLGALPAGIIASGFVVEIRKRDFVVSWRLVAKVPLFARLPALDIATIADMLRPELLPAHHRILTKGEIGDRMYFIVEGMVEVDLPERLVRLGPGDFFGEIALLRRVPRTASVVSLTEVRLLYIEQGPFQDLLRDHPDIARTVEAVARERDLAPARRE